jgi:hypothetical protein
VDEKGQQDKPHLEAAAPSLVRAIRRARIEDAEHSEVMAELRGAEIARLQMLQEALGPVLAQLPADLDLFDTGLVVGDRPRLFVDMLAFVEMGRDRRTYRFLQDTRHGRTELAQSERVDMILEAIAAYMARRLIEREKALASDGSTGQGHRREDATVPPAPVPQQAVTEIPAAVAPRRPRSLFVRVLGGLIDVLGTLALIALVGAGLWLAWRSGQEALVALGYIR